MWAQLPVDGQIRWEKTVKSFLLAFQYSQGGKKQACNTSNNFKKRKEKKSKLILPPCIFKHAPRVSHSPSCVLIPADISSFTPGIPLSVFSAYLNLSQVSESNSDSTCSGGPVLITLPEILFHSLCPSSNYSQDALFGQCYWIPGCQLSFHIYSPCPSFWIINTLWGGLISNFLCSLQHNLQHCWAYNRSSESVLFANILKVAREAHLCRKRGRADIFASFAISSTWEAQELCFGGEPSSPPGTQQPLQEKGWQK